MKQHFRTAATTLVIALAASAPALAEEVKLPSQISWTAYGTTSSGYAQSVGIGQMLTKNYGTSLRIIPGKNDVSRMVPLREGQSPLCACGFAAYMAQEGAFMFGTKKWGPMKLYNMFNNIGDNGQQAVVAGDAGVRTIKDIKGKRVTFVKGAPALNVNMEAFLAFAGYTWDDVEQVVVPGWKQSIDAIINGQADLAWGSTASSAYNQLAASPRGLYFVNLPHDDKEAWKRAKAIAPHWAPQMVSVGVDLKSNESGKVPFEGNNFPYPIFVAVPEAEDSLVYGLTKGVMENYEQIKDAGPSMGGYQLSKQSLQWIFPYHPGSIKYFKEKGLWTAEHDKHNEGLMKRQQVLEDAWKTMDQNLADDKFEAEWKKVRAAALDAAGMPVPFR
ncbi:MAG: TAXI family TRAP transporter solute-binding subunit [Alphaproteobacteria bacterium]|nr:TAXI family TRAP transporter solute-binding subunit [Alphaproteobacteria bacterium]